MRRVARSTRVLALAAMVLAAACIRPPLDPPLPTSRGLSLSWGEQFDTLWTRFAAVYPSFTYKQVDWEAQRARYRPRASRARSQDELVAILIQMLAPLRDRHVWLVDPRGGIVPTYRPAAAVNFDRGRWTAAMRDVGYVARNRDLGDATIGGYGYLFIGSWRGVAGTDLLDAMLSRHREAPGLILDLRVNAGGRDAAALAFVSRFTTRPFAASYVQVLTPVVSSVELPMARTIAPGGPWQFTRPVVVITGRGGLSATESFVAAMRTLPQVTVIGDTTGGASGNPATYPLGHGWHFTVPRWMEYGPDQRPIEGLGVAPHLALPWLPATYADRRDPLIDAAVGLLAERIGVYRIAPVAPEAPPRLDEPRMPH